MHNNILSVSENPKAVAAISTITTVAGVSTVLNYLPPLLGCVTAMFGIVLTGVLIKNGLLKAKKTQLEIDLLKDREIERLKERQDSGRPCRRDSDTPIM